MGSTPPGLVICEGKIRSWGAGSSASITPSSHPNGWLVRPVDWQIGCHLHVFLASKASQYGANLSGLHQLAESLFLWLLFGPVQWKAPADGRWERNTRSLSSLAPFLSQLLCSGWIPIHRALAPAGWLSLHLQLSLNSSKQLLPGTFKPRGGNSILTLTSQVLCHFLLALHNFAHTLLNNPPLNSL